MVIKVLPGILSRNIRAMTIYPFIFLKEERLRDDKKLINHETIHIKQQLETLIIPFYIWYLLEYLFRVFQYGEFTKAYRNISFEKEAYRNQYDLKYLEKRKRYSFVKHFR